MVHAKPIVLPARLSGVIALAGAAPPPEPPAPPVEVAPPPAPPAPEEAWAKERAEIRAMLASLSEAVRGLKARHTQPLEELQRLAVELGVAVAARLVHAKIAAGEFGVENLVRDLISHLHPKQAVTVSLHPDDLVLLEKRLDESPAALVADVPIHMRGDPSLKRGDCKAQTGDLCVWADLQRQLWETRDLLLEGLPFNAPDKT